MLFRAVGFVTEHLLGGSNDFLQKIPKSVRSLLTSTKTAQMPLDLRSNDLEARITVASRLREHLMFYRMGEYEVLPHRRFYGDMISLRSNSPQ